MMQTFLHRRVTFSCFSDAIQSHPDAIISFNSVGANDEFISEVIEVGLENVDYKTHSRQIDSLFKSGYATNQSYVFSNIILCYVEKPNRSELVKLLLVSVEAIG